MNFVSLNIYGDYGRVEREIILEFEREFNIRLPPLYINLVMEHNSPWCERNCFEYIKNDEYPNGRRLAEFNTGERAVFRPSKTGPMTIELQRPDGNKIIEVRYVQ